MGQGSPQAGQGEGTRRWLWSQTPQGGFKSRPMEQKARWTYLVCSVFSTLTAIPRALTVSRSHPSPVCGHKQGLGVKMLKPLPSQLLKDGSGAPETKLVAAAASCCGAAVVPRWKASRDGNPVPRKAWWPVPWAHSASIWSAARTFLQWP